MEREQVAVREGVIRLGQFLKLAGVVDTGGEACEALKKQLVSCAWGR